MGFLLVQRPSRTGYYESLLYSALYSQDATYEIYGTSSMKNIVKDIAYE
jgi:hypothetical protein